MTKEYTKLVTVRGALAFPIDMLRYDRAYPRTECDAIKIQSSFQDFVGKLEIELLSLDMPHIPRWASFGWEVVRTERAP